MVTPPITVPTIDVWAIIEKVIIVLVFILNLIGFFVLIMRNDKVRSEDKDSEQDKKDKEHLEKLIDDKFKSLKEDLDRQAEVLDKSSRDRYSGLKESVNSWVLSAEGAWRESTSRLRDDITRIFTRIDVLQSKTDRACERIKAVRENCFKHRKSIKDEEEDI